MIHELKASGENFLQDIYVEPYIDDLLSVIKGNGDIEEFISSRDKKNRDNFVKEATEKRQNSIDEKNNFINQAKEEIHKLKEEKRVYNELSFKVEKLKELCPKDKKQDLEKILNGVHSSDDLQKKISEFTTPKKGLRGLVEKITSGKKLKQVNIQLYELAEYCEDNNVFNSSSKLYQSALTGQDATKELEASDIKITEKQSDIKTYEQAINLLQENIKKDIDLYDNEPDTVLKRNIENDIIRQFAKQKSPYINNPPTISKEEIAATGLNEDFIEGQIMQSRYAGNVRASVRRFYEGLDRPAAPMVAFCYGKRADKRAQQEIIDNLKAMGINAVADTDEKAKDPTVFVVTQKSIQAPFMAPDEALKANIKMIEAICQSEHAEHPFLSNPLTREALAVAADGNLGLNMTLENVAMNNGSDWERITGGDIDGYFAAMINEAYSRGQDPGFLDTENATAFNRGEAFKSVFHGGKCSDPYAVLCCEDNMNFVYGAGGACGDAWSPDVKYDNWRPDGALGYSFGKSSHNLRHLSAGGLQFGFLCEYESRGDKQEFIGIDREGAKTFGEGKLNRKYFTKSGASDETTVLPHQNKLKRIYITARTRDRQTRVFPLDLDENGQVKDKRWRDFIELTKPIDDNLRGFMVERRNNMMADYDAGGKEKFMNRTLEEINQQKLDYVSAEKREFKQYIPTEQVKDKTSFVEPPPIPGYAGAMPPPIPTQDNAAMPPPIPTQDNTIMPPPIPGYAGAMPPPIPTQDNAAMPPPIPNQDNTIMPPPIPGYAGAMPPPIPTQDNTVTPPPIPQTEQTAQKFAEMSSQEQGKVILSMRKGLNPLLPKVTEVPSMVNTQTQTQTKAVDQTQAIMMASIMNNRITKPR